MARPKQVAAENVHITPAKVEEIGLEVWGERWREEMAKFLGISYSQLHRYMTIYKGQQIPKVVAVALIMRRQFLHDNALPNFDSFVAPASESKPVKFVQVAKPKPEKPDLDAPVIDMFGEAPVTVEAEAPKIEEPAKVEPQKATTKTGQGRKAGQDRTAKEAKPKAEKPAKAAPKTKPEKPAKTAPAKRPAPAKAEKTAPAKRPAPRRKDTVTA